MHFIRFLPSLLIVVAASAFHGNADAAAQSTNALAERSWVLEAADGFGIITAIERCGDVLFIADAQQKIRRFDTATIRLLTNLGSDQVAFPTALVADCQGRRLFVLTGIPLRKGASGAVQMFDLDSGDLRLEYPLPQNFVPRPGGRFEAPNSIIVSGLWIPSDRSPADLLQQPASRYYDGLRLGLKMTVDTAAVDPLLVPYELACIGAGACPDVRVDSVMTARGAIRVAAIPTSTAIGTYEAATTSTRVIDVRSPRFVRDGRTLAIDESAEARMKWSGQNSTIAHVFAFDDGIVAVHARPQIGPNYHLGDWVSFTVYMNAYGWDGQVRGHDIPLPDLPVGRDDKHLYVVDYGREGRRSGARSIRLLQIPISRVGQ